MVGGAEEKSKIAAIFNKYKDIFDNLINSSDAKSSDHPDFPNWPGLIDKKSHNAPKSRDNSPTFSEEDHLNKDILITSLEPTSIIRDSQVYQRHNVATLSAKSERTQYEKGQQSRENGKSKRCGEDGEGERSRESHWRNKVNLVVRENSGSEASIYHHIIFKC